MTPSEIEHIVLALEDCLYMAVLLLRHFEISPDTVFTPEGLVQSAKVPFSRASEAMAVTERFSDLGLCRSYGHSYVPDPQRKRSWRSLADMLEGAYACQNMLEVRRKKEEPKLVVTTPGIQSRFAGLIREDTGLYVRTSQTSDVLQSLAAKAERRLVIMTPFLDREGAEMVRGLFGKTTPGVKKHLVLRFLSDSENRGCVRGIDHISGDLERMGAVIHDFTLTGEDGYRETFHAKVVCKDDDQAYVGSANLIQERSIEMGLLVFGETAQRVARTVDIALDISNIICTL